MRIRDRQDRLTWSSTPLCELGEGRTWDAAGERLLWLDVDAPALHQLDRNGEHLVTALGGRATALVPTVAGGCVERGRWRGGRGRSVGADRQDDRDAAIRRGRRDERWSLRPSWTVLGPGPPTVRAPAGLACSASPPMDRGNGCSVASDSRTDSTGARTGPCATTSIRSPTRSPTSTSVPTACRCPRARWCGSTSTPDGVTVELRWWDLGGAVGRRRGGTATRPTAASTPSCPVPGWLRHQLRVRRSGPGDAVSSPRRGTGLSEDELAASPTPGALFAADVGRTGCGYTRSVTSPDLRSVRGLIAGSLTQIRDRSRQARRPRGRDERGGVGVRRIGEDIRRPAGSHDHPVAEDDDLFAQAG